MHKYSPADSTFDAAVKRIIAEDAAEAKAAFHLRMRMRGLQDRAVLRAFDAVPRHDFVPHRYQDLALRDVALPIGCGQTMDEPWLVARMIEALMVEPQHRVLEIGAGSGYATAILAHLAHEVIALERYKTLAASAQERLATLQISNAAVVWADGMALPQDLGPFDRIIVQGLLTESPSRLVAWLKDDGVLVCSRRQGDGQAMVRFKTTANKITETAICPCRMQPMVPGLAGTL